MSRLKIDITMSMTTNPLCGGKATTLTKLKQAGLHVPSFYVIPTTSFDSFCQHIGILSFKNFYENRKYDPEIEKKFIDVNAALLEEYLQIIDDGEYMVRSSSIPSEDIDLKMFPSMISGAFETYHATSKSEVARRILDVWSSLFTEKAYNQCRLFSQKSIISGIGVILQKYIAPIVSGVAHTEDNIVSINWIEGHLSKIVGGEDMGNSVTVYRSPDQCCILRGIEDDILLVKNKHLEDVFRSIWNDSMSAKEVLGSEQEVEWIYDGTHVWIVQSQHLIV